MLIKFKKPDPRAGQVARMDSSRGQHFVDIGAAELVKDGAAATVAQTSPAEALNVADAAEQLVAANAADVISALGEQNDIELLRAALAAEQSEAGKRRKKVIESLEARIAALEQPQG